MIGIGFVQGTLSTVTQMRRLSSTVFSFLQGPTVFVKSFGPHIHAKKVFKVRVQELGLDMVWGVLVPEHGCLGYMALIIWVFLVSPNSDRIPTSAEKPRCGKSCRRRRVGELLRTSLLGMPRACNCSVAPQQIRDRIEHV